MGEGTLYPCQGRKALRKLLTQMSRWRHPTGSANDKYRKNEHGRWIGPDGKQMDGRLVPMIPVVNVEKCTGCGACENLCPVGPQSAIYVEGHDVHREI